MTELQVDSGGLRYSDANGEPRRSHSTGEDRSWRLTCIGGMASVMAHRLAQPMTAINALASSSLKAARDPVMDTGKLVDNLVKIEQQARRATEMIRGFAQFAHRGAPDIGTVAVDDALAGTLAVLDADIRQHDISVRFERTPGLPRVVADATAVEQIASCLMRNAIDAVVRGGRAREIAISAAPTDDGLVEVTVADTGCGIDPAIAPTLFDPFAPERPGECGVGLAVTRAIVEALGGRINIKSCEGRGAVVAFALPAEKRGDMGERRV